MPYKDPEKRKAAARAATARYRAKHPERVKEQDTQYRNTPERKAYVAQYRQTHKDEIKQRLHIWYEDNKESALNQHKEWKQANKGYLRQQAREQRQALKHEVLLHYDAKCVECGVDDIDTLCIDHVNDAGKQHRMAIGDANIYSWLKNNGYPEGYQVLCANCNYKKELTRRTRTLSKKPDTIAGRKSYMLRRNNVLKYYGGKCVHCGCDDPDVLCFDHINGGGQKHRISAKFTRIAWWLYKNGFPEGFQILCHNCNLKKYVAIESKI